MGTAKDVAAALHTLANTERAAQMQRYFKTGPGEYAQGDQMLGISVPQQRAVARQFRDISVPQALSLLKSPWHEVRLTSLFLLVHLYKKGDAAQQRAVFDGYLANLAHVNNWDLVDSSAPYIVGAFTADNPLPLLKKLVKSKRRWDRRVAAISTFHHLSQGESEPTLFVAKALVHDKDDLIHKAVGWMLREMGQRVDNAALHAFLDEHAATMPRTMLRYALEKLSAKDKARYMAVAAKQGRISAKPVVSP